MTGLQTALDAKVDEINQTAISLNGSGAEVLDTLVVNTQGQTTSATFRTLTAADIGAASGTHSHVIGDVTGLQTALDGKVDELNQAVIALDGTGAQVLDTLNVNAQGQVTSAAFRNLGAGDIGAAAATHSHVIGDVTGLQNALDGKVDELNQGVIALDGSGAQVLDTLNVNAQGQVTSAAFRNITASDVGAATEAYADTAADAAQAAAEATAAGALSASQTAQDAAIALAYQPLDADLTEIAKSNLATLGQAASTSQGYNLTVTTDASSVASYTWTADTGGQAPGAYATQTGSGTVSIGAADFNKVIFLSGASAIVATIADGTIAGQWVKIFNNGTSTTNTMINGSITGGNLEIDDTTANFEMIWDGTVWRILTA